MGQQTINNGDTGLVARTKINENFTEVYGQGVNTVNVTVSSAEILNIFSSPKTLLAAPVAGTIYIVLGIVAKYFFVTTNYVTNANLRVLQNGRIVLQVDSLLMTTGSANRWQMTAPNNPGSVGNADPEAAAIILTHGTGNPTGGDGTLSITITYVIVSI